MPVVFSAVRSKPERGVSGFWRMRSTMARMPTPGHDLDERVHAEAKQGERLVVGAKIDRNQPFDQVIEDRKQRQPEGILPVLVGGRSG